MAKEAEAIEQSKSPEDQNGHKPDGPDQDGKQDKVWSSSLPLLTVDFDIDIACPFTCGDF